MNMINPRHTKPGIESIVNHRGLQSQPCYRVNAAPSQTGKEATRTTEEKAKRNNKDDEKSEDRKHGESNGNKKSRFRDPELEATTRRMKLSKDQCEESS